MQTFKEFLNYTAEFGGFYQRNTAELVKYPHCYAIRRRRGIPSTGI